MLDGKSGPSRGMLTLHEDGSRKGPQLPSSISSCLNLLLCFKCYDSCVTDSCHFVKLTLAFESGLGMIRWGWAATGSAGTNHMTHRSGPGLRHILKSCVKIFSQSTLTVDPGLWQSSSGLQKFWPDLLQGSSELIRVLLFCQLWRATEIYKL